MSEVGTAHHGTSEHSSKSNVLPKYDGAVILHQRNTEPLINKMQRRTGSSDLTSSRLGPPGKYSSSLFHDPRRYSWISQTHPRRPTLFREFEVQYLELS